MSDRKNSTEETCWFVWVEGRPNPNNMGRRPRYCLGVLRGIYNDVVDQARKYWPQYNGRRIYQKRGVIEPDSPALYENRLARDLSQKRKADSARRRKAARAKLAHEGRA